MEKIPKAFLVIASLVVIAWLANLIAAISMAGEVSGVFGDTFGVVNSLFTGLAFLGLSVAIFYQRAELKIVREEREDTREILAEQRRLNTTHENTLKRQTFDSNFLGYLRMIIDLRQSLLIKSTSNKTTLGDAAATSREMLGKLSEYWGNSAKRLKPNQEYCLPIIKLSTTVVESVKNTDVLSEKEKLGYYAKVSVLMDRNISTVFAIYAAMNVRRKPEFVTAFQLLDIARNLEPEISAPLHDFIKGESA